MLNVEVEANKTDVANVANDVTNVANDDANVATSYELTNWDKAIDNFIAPNISQSISKPY